MRILAVGDIVGESGVEQAKEWIPQIKKEEHIDFVVVNGENAAGGMGITEKIFKQLLSVGTDVVTMGNHTWGKKDIFSFIDHPRIIRPANYAKGVVGKGYGIYTCEYKGKEKRIAVINLIGRVDVNVLSENPFICVRDIMAEIKEKCDYSILDFHAEATAEKIAMGHYLDGEVNIVYGTHTHVQTADETILEKGTGYITDIGMTGPVQSVIGMDIAASIKRFETTLPEKYKLASGDCRLNGCIFELNDENGRINKITRISK